MPRNGTLTGKSDRGRARLAHLPAVRALNIVIVEDNAETRLFLRSFLVKKGHHVVLESERGDDARLWDAHGDVAVVDLNLPGADGYDVIDELKERMPVLALTSSLHDESVSQALLKGASGYVVKGAPMSEVVRAIEQVAGRQPGSVGAQVVLRRRDVAAHQPGASGDVLAASVRRSR